MIADDQEAVEMAEKNFDFHYHWHAQYALLNLYDFTYISEILNVDFVQFFTQDIEQIQYTDEAIPSLKKFRHPQEVWRSLYLSFKFDYNK